MVDIFPSDEPSSMVVGIDEVGRGPLAGPVVCVALAHMPITPYRHFPLAWQDQIPDGLERLPVADSKTLSESKRVMIAENLSHQHCARYRIWWQAGCATATEIDVLNIRRATLLAMERALVSLWHRLPPEMHADSYPPLVVTDGRDAVSTAHLPRRECGRSYPTIAIVKGDRHVWTIAAASIIAKVMRDDMARLWHRRYPRYGFDRHKGYGTLEHRRALLRYGPCFIHRRTFIKSISLPAMEKSDCTQ